MNWFYINIYPYFQILFKLIIFFGLPYLIGNIILRLVFSIIGHPLKDKLSLIPIVLSFILGFLICFYLPILKSFEVNAYNDFKTLINNLNIK